MLIGQIPQIRLVVNLWVFAPNLNEHHWKFSAWSAGEVCPFIDEDGLDCWRWSQGTEKTRVFYFLPGSV
jgi:hypothetical protein